MLKRTARELDDAEGRCLSRRSETSPAHSATYAPTTAAGRSAAPSHPRPQACSCCEPRQPARTLADIGPDGDEGRRLRRVTVAWFSACIVALFLLWHGVADVVQWSELRSVSEHDLGAQVAHLGNETG